MLVNKFYILFYVSYGVFSANRILKGAFICEYYGELLSYSKGEKRRDTYKDKDGNFVYFFERSGSKLW